MLVITGGYIPKWIRHPFSPQNSMFFHGCGEPWRAVGNLYTLDEVDELYKVSHRFRFLLKVNYMVILLTKSQNKHVQTQLDDNLWSCVLIKSGISLRSSWCFGVFVTHTFHVYSIYGIFNNTCRKRIQMNIVIHICRYYIYI